MNGPTLHRTLCLWTWAVHAGRACWGYRVWREDFLPGPTSVGYRKRLLASPQLTPAVALTDCSLN